MKKQLQGIALILLAIVLMLGFGGAPFFDLDFGWSVPFALMGIIGTVMVFLPEGKAK